MKFRIQSANFNNACAVKYSVIKRRYNYHAHIHQYAELIIPTKGTLSVTVGNKTEVFGVGKAALIFPFQVHEYKSDEYNELNIFVFSPSLIPELFSATDGSVDGESVFTPKKSSLDILKNNVIEKENFDIFDIKSAFYLIASDYSSSVSLRKSSKKHDLSVEIVKYVAERYGEKITVSDIAKALKYSERNISSEIHSLFNENLTSLVSAIRIEKSTDMLTQTDKSCAQIAYECGFGSERSFYRQFKKIVGISPSEYRQVAKKTKGTSVVFTKEF